MDEISFTEKYIIVCRGLMQYMRRKKSREDLLLYKSMLGDVLRTEPHLQTVPLRQL